MQIQAWDEVFIRCRRATANALVVDVPSWATWWPGVDVSPTAGAATPGPATSGPATSGPATFDVAVRTPGDLRSARLPGRQRLQVTVDRVRPRDKGVELTVAGDVTGTAEWYHLDRPDGVVVHWLLNGSHEGDARRWLAAHRAAVRRGLTDLKRRLERGRTPGAEPHPALLAHQAEELAEFAREVARHEEELAAARAAQTPLAQADPSS